MSTPRLSLIMGDGIAVPQTADVTLPFPESGAVHLHLHLSGPAAPVAEVAKRPLAGLTGLIVGVALMAAFGGGYQFGHRPAPEDVSNLRPMPALGSFVPPEPMPGIAATGLPAIQRQLATPPQINSPVRLPQQPSVPAAGPAPGATATPGSPRNVFGLEN